MHPKTWKDYKLAWNETQYGDLKSIRLPAKMIWTPDILMYNRYKTYMFGRIRYMTVLAFTLCHFSI